MATDEVYYATENGQILDVDYQHMNMFRFGTLYGLLAKVPSSIGRIGRPNNIVDCNRLKSNNRSSSQVGKSAMRANGSMQDDSQMSDAGRNTLKRRGTVNLVKNFMVSKIQKA